MQRRLPSMLRKKGARPCPSSDSFVILNLLCVGRPPFCFPETKCPPGLCRHRHFGQPKPCSPFLSLLRISSPRDAILTDRLSVRIVRTCVLRFRRSQLEPSRWMLIKNGGRGFRGVSLGTRGEGSFLKTCFHVHRAVLGATAGAGTIPH